MLFLQAFIWTDRETTDKTYKTIKTRKVRKRKNEFLFKKIRSVQDHITKTISHFTFKFIRKIKGTEDIVTF